MIRRLHLHTTIPELLQRNAVRPNETTPVYWPPRSRLVFYPFSFLFFLSLFSLTSVDSNARPTIHKHAESNQSCAKRQGLLK